MVGVREVFIEKINLNFKKSISKKISDLDEKNPLKHFSYKNDVYARRKSILTGFLYAIRRQMAGCTSTASKRTHA